MYGMRTDKQLPFFFFSPQSLLQSIVHFTFCISLQRIEMKLPCDAATVQATSELHSAVNLIIFLQVYFIGKWKRMKEKDEENKTKAIHAPHVTRYSILYSKLLHCGDGFRSETFYTLLHRTTYNTSLLSVFYFHTRYAFDRSASARAHTFPSMSSIRCCLSLPLRPSSSFSVF